MYRDFIIIDTAGGRTQVPVHIPVLQALPLLSHFTISKPVSSAIKLKYGVTT